MKLSQRAVLFISGIGGRTPGAQFTIGGSVNAALLSPTKSLGNAGLRDRIRVNVINPGTIRTQRFQIRVETLARAKGITWKRKRVEKSSGGGRRWSCNGRPNSAVWTVLAGCSLWQRAYNLTRTRNLQTIAA